MTTRKDVQSQKKDEPKTRDTGELKTRREPEITLRPAVDIYEDDQGISVVADLPGVSRERLNVNLEGHSLSIEGEMVIDTPEGMEPLYADIRTTRFRRSFTLSSELESDKISASMADGVLTLQLPKRPELQPRRIEVSTA